ncbi:hypothetical protein F5Y11DRAFT_190275 [Daldinia sp. FL1419]|nr:hypothetical protein F5Y11DRAFT_190275 [Daldinia sp. FL1419]
MALLKKRIGYVADPCDESFIVNITVPSGKEFSIHAHLLAKYSKYFQRALDSQFQEAKTLRFDLTEHATDETLSVFTNWVYAKSVSSGNILIIHSILKECPGFALIKCWLFGEYIQAREFQNDIIETLPEANTTSTDAVNAWDSIPADSKFRQLLVSLFCKQGRSLKKVHAELEFLPPTMLRDVSKYLATEISKQQVLRTSILDTKKYLE